MKACVTSLALGTLAAAPLFVAPVFAGAPSGPKHVHRVFDIMRKGSKIGTDTFDISRAGDRTDVKVASHIQVKLAFITAYRYDHTDSETFKGGQLVAFKAKTDDNGTNHDIAATQSGGKLTLTVDGTPSVAPKSLVPASLWGPDIAKKSQVFDPADGKRMAVRAQDLGQETVSLNGVPRQLQHVKLSGEFARDLWFDEDGLVKMTMLGSDNSEVTAQLRQSTASN